ncbi:MAG TPA: hypothetical protein VFF27_12295, partial [Bacteroidia bacterium]|nr:hypothetical protein [Bacteroidia bacterium]
MKRLLIALALLFVSAGIYAQNRVDSVSSNYSDLNGGATVKTLLIGFDRCSGLTYTYNSVKLYQYFHLGTDYKYGTAINSASVTLTIDVYSTTSGSTGLMQSFANIMLPINQDAPEKLYLQDITNLVKTGAKRVVVTSSAFSCSVPYQSRIRLSSFYKEDVGVNVIGKSVTTNNPTIKNPVKFIWSRNATQQCIPNYQVQVLRLFNRDSLKSGNELQLKDVIDWSKAVSIETGSPDTALLLTLAEGRGYYTWRVRPIGTAYPGGIANWRNYGSWNSTSLADGATVNFTSNPYASSILFFYYQFNEDKNWIYSRTFSEGDPLNTKVRLSESITYANGLQQTKQQQGKQQSTNRVIANQTIYDYSGRPALVTLPAPIDSVPPAGGDTLGYVNGFIKVGSTLYTAQHFDDNSTYFNPTAATSGPLIDYYSNSNSDKFVANAEGYPYGRTVYTKDGTGRVKEVGAPGENGRIKSTNDHTAKVIYSGVSDQELIRIFGDEAPKDTSVYKSLSIDPNKTATISYINKEGQTIATALSISTDSIGSILDTLPGYKNARITINDTLWAKGPFGKFGVTSNKPLAFAVPTNVSLKYTIRKKDITQLCMNYCTTCDYTIQFLLHTEDTSIVIASKLLPASMCTSPPVKWDTAFTKLVDGGKKYILEKRVFANSTKPGSSPLKTYLDISIDSIRNTYDRTATDSLKYVFGFLRRNSMDSLYRYLNHGTFINFNIDGVDSVFADSAITKSIGCYTIRIPITYCKKDVCPADFEKYFDDRWKGTVYADDAGTAYLDYLVPPYGQTTYRFQKGQFNWLIKNMLNNGYDCQKIWTCWKRLVMNYKGMKEMADTTTSGYKFDLMEEFLRCTGRKLIGYHDTDTSKFLGQAYKYFYRVSPTTTCDQAMTTTYGTLSGWAQDSLVAINPLSKKWENYYNCIRNLNPTGPTETKNMAIDGCQQACNARYGAFKQSIINMYHNDSIYIEGDKYKLKKDTIWGQKYSFDIDTLVFPPTSSFYRSMANVECLTQKLIEGCYSSCKLTTYDTLGGKKFGTFAEIAEMKKAMTWNFEIKRSVGSCGSGWKRISESVASDVTSYVVWDKNYGGTGFDNFARLTKLSDGFIIAGNTSSAKSYDVTNSSKGGFDFWIVRMDNDGKILWDKTIGGSDNDGFGTGPTTYEIIQTSDGGFMIGGTTLSGVSGDKTSASKGKRDYWILKLNELGNIQWQKSFGGSEDDYLMSTIQTRDGKYILAGMSSSNTGGDKTQNIKAGSSDYWVIKLDQNGDKIWDKAYSSTGQDDLGSALETVDGNYILLGTTDGGLGYDKSQASQGSRDFWIIKIDTAGNKIWDKRYGGVSWDGGGSMIQNSDGTLILAGISDSNIGGDKSQNSYGGTDIWVLKINSVGTKIWDKTYGGSGTESATQQIGLCKTSDNGYLIAAMSNSNISGTKSENSFGQFDYWLIKTDSLGNKKYDRSYGGSSYDWLGDVKEDQKGNYWLVGYSYNNVSGNKTQNNYPPGYIDAWVVKTKQPCSHDSICFRWTQPAYTYKGDSATTEFKYLTCDSVNSNYVYNSIIQQIQQNIDVAISAYTNDYIATCASPGNIKDTCSISYSQGFYNYTLYYYDRAGNLVRTVPPNGVNYKDASNVLVTKRSQHNAHKFVTKYWYNSIKQLVRQETPDGGQTNFWYDFKGQLRASQNAKQKLAGKYSYTKYDPLGRITEVGESSDSISTFNKVWNLNTANFPVNNNKERTYTVYTTPASYIYYQNFQPQRYLQNRVSYTYTDDNVYTYYSY